MLVGIGYAAIRQKGSHVRLRHPGPPVHKVSVPLHYPLKRTLHGIPSDVAQMRSVTTEFVAQLL
jgi:hypothetical protein